MQSPKMTVVEARILEASQRISADTEPNHDECCAFCDRGDFTQGLVKPPYAFVIDTSMYDKPATESINLLPVSSFMNLAQSSLKMMLPQMELPLRKIIEDVSDVLAGITGKATDQGEVDDTTASFGVCRQVIRNDEHRWGILLLRDATAVVEYANGEVETLANPNRDKLRKLRDGVLMEMLDMVTHAKQQNQDGPQNVFEAMKTPRIQRMLRRIAERANTLDGYWALGRNRDAAMNAARYEIACRDVRKIFLYTHGFNCQILGMSAATIVQSCQTSDDLERLWHRIRAAENEDEAGEFQPRFRKHCNMSAVLVECDPSLYT